MEVPAHGVSTERVLIPAGNVRLDGDLSLPSAPHGLVIFVHGSGSSRRSRRNRFVAGQLHLVNLATLQFDLLTDEEKAVDATTRPHRFDIKTLSERLAIVTDWVAQDPRTRRLPIGYFGASTGAAAALVVAALRPDLVAAVVSRGGRPDLAGHYISQVSSATLLIVGGEDHHVVDLNQRAYTLLKGEKDLAVVPGATHLFQEPGALERVAILASDWFAQHLRRKAGALSYG